MDTLKEYISNLTDKFKGSAYNEEVVDMLDEINDNKDLICNLYYYPVQVDLNKNGYILAKDCLLYLAHSSLIRYENTKERAYKLLPYEYYHHVSDMSNSYFPHKVRIGNSDKLWFDDFREKYEEVIGKDFIPLFNDSALEKSELICGWEILSSGKAETEVRNFDNHYIVKILKIKN